MISGDSEDILFALVKETKKCPCGVPPYPYIDSGERIKPPVSPTKFVLTEDMSKLLKELLTMRRLGVVP
jgi:hypothetical protein